MLMLGVYLPTEGEVLFDDQSLHTLDLSALRSQIGVVLQDQFLFAGSIRQNIAFGAAQLTLEQVAAAAQFADIHSEIQMMPMGYETVLYEGGANLSGGQRQRLLIARAIASSPHILLLDEATSYLDNITEAHVEANLSTLSCTRIVIAHRLSTVRNADNILVMSGGVLVEQGTDEQLRALGGEYTHLSATLKR
jgi:ABC-type bacteriocin/lantibiotic exporter with double-glycine peptidase domain